MKDVLTYVLGFLLSLSCCASLSWARVPDEVESQGGHALGFGNAGAVASSGISSVRANPAMLAVEKQYTVHAGYHWPSSGRDFYQLGVVDSKTSPVAAGVSYTEGVASFSTQGLPGAPSSAEQEQILLDSPIERRASLGFAMPLEYFALGIGGEFVEGFPPVAFERWQGLEEVPKQRGIGVHLGAAGLVTKMIRFGVSAENLNQSTMMDLAPTVYRGSVAVILMGGSVTLHVDVHRRERVAQELEYQRQQIALATAEAPYQGPDMSRPEDMATGSFSVRMYDMFMLLGGYAHELHGEHPRRSLSGGLALVNQMVSLSYMASRPYLADAKSHHAVNLAIQMNM
ncbi:MAG: hypothetical protein OXT67_10100 [Zetaproteobacteria bacterium]|nr:hypothetical protein [Zetaproteobacteria bacterium]